MARKKERKIPRGKIRGALITSTLSITLLIFLLGIIGYLVLNAQRLSEHVKENICFSLILKDDAKTPDIMKFKKEVDKFDFVKSTELISREEAAESLQEELGEDFIDFLGYNPLSASVDVYLYADYTHPDSVAKMETRFLQYDKLISEVDYQKDLVQLVNENVRNISLVLLVFSALLLLISFTLINNTIRLMVYSKRFIIRTMQLVGATRGFIRRPFLAKGVFQGLISALLAICLLVLIMYFATQEFREVISLADLRVIIPLFLIVLGLGIIISYISTLFAVNKYLRIKPENLYY